MTSLLTTDAVIEELGGCGIFQWMFVILVLSTCMTAAWSTMFMSFGNYNPGWRCLDESTTTESMFTQVSRDLINASKVDTVVHHVSRALFNISTERAEKFATLTSLDTSTSSMLSSTNSSLVVTDSVSGYSQSCDAYSACSNVEFYTTESTIVTEWILICERNWIVNMITSVTMAGGMISNLIGGQLTDRFGRRTVLLIALFALTVFNLVAIFSTSWMVYAALRFLIGVSASLVLTVHMVFCSEFITGAWRPALGASPKWNIATVIFALLAMALKDWKHLHILTSAVSFALLIAALWTPESFRWLVVKYKPESAYKVTKKIAWWNKSKGVSFEDIEYIAKSESNNASRGNNNFTFIRLFRRDLLKKTLSCMFIYFAMNVQYYTIAFGVKSLSGNLYVNLILSQLSALPFLFIAPFIAVRLGRKWSIFVFLVVANAGCFASVLVHFFGDESTSGLIIMILAMLVISVNATAWGVCNSFMIELYPTVLRGVAYGFIYSVPRLGAVLAPFLIPASPKDVYLSYLVMGVLGMVNIVLLLGLPETKGQPLTDTISTTKAVFEEEGLAKDLMKEENRQSSKPV